MGLALPGPPPHDPTAPARFGDLVARATATFLDRHTTAARHGPATRPCPVRRTHPGARPAGSAPRQASARDAGSAQCRVRPRQTRALTIPPCRISAPGPAMPGPRNAGSARQTRTLPGRHAGSAPRQVPRCRVRAMPGPRPPDPAAPGPRRGPRPLPGRRPQDRGWHPWWRSWKVRTPLRASTFHDPRRRGGPGVPTPEGRAVALVMIRVAIRRRPRPPIAAVATTATTAVADLGVISVQLEQIGRDKSKIGGRGGQRRRAGTRSG